MKGKRIRILSTLILCCALISTSHTKAVKAKEAISTSNLPVNARLKPMQLMEDVQENDLVLPSVSLEIIDINQYIAQGQGYTLPATVKIGLNGLIEKEVAVQWRTSIVDTNVPGIYTFEGVAESSDKPVKLTLTVDMPEKEITVKEDFKCKLDDFFSCFSSAHIASFENSNLSNDDLIDFALIRISEIDPYANLGFVDVKSADPKIGYIKSSTVDDIVNCFFGKKQLIHRTILCWPFENGYYKFPIDSRHTYVFSQVNKLFDIGNDNFIADLNVYEAPEGFKGNPHDTEEQWKKTDKDKLPQFQGRVTARFRKVIENGEESFKLISYN